MLFPIPRTISFNSARCQFSSSQTASSSSLNKNIDRENILLLLNTQNPQPATVGDHETIFWDSLHAGYKKYRDWFGYLLPIVVTIFLTCFTFAREGELLELIAKPVSYFLNATSLTTIIADSVLVIAPETADMISKLSHSMHEINLKNIFYSLSKLIPLVFISKVIFGEGVFSRFKQGKNLIHRDSLLKQVLRKEISLVPLVEALKAQVVNLGGLTTISSPLKTLVWWIRSRICEGPIAHLATHAFVDRNSPKAQMLKTAVGTAMMAIMDSWRIGLVKNSSRTLCNWFPFLKQQTHDCSGGDQLVDFADLVG